MLIANRMIGTGESRSEADRALQESMPDLAEQRRDHLLTLPSLGIFATPASIVVSTGSIGLALILWVVGAIIAAAGLAVYLEFAAALPKSGGEKNYLEYSYRRPLYLITCGYAAYAALLGWPSGNSVYAGEMLLNAANTEVGRWNQRGIGCAVLLFALAVHGCAPKWGLRLQNALGFFKIGVLLFIIIAGFV